MVSMPHLTDWDAAESFARKCHIQILMVSQHDAAYMSQRAMEVELAASCEVRTISTFVAAVESVIHDRQPPGIGSDLPLQKTEGKPTRSPESATIPPQPKEVTIGRSLPDAREQAAAKDRQFQNIADSVAAMNFGYPVRTLFRRTSTSAGLTLPDEP